MAREKTRGGARGPGGPIRNLDFFMMTRVARKGFKRKMCLDGAYDQMQTFTEDIWLAAATVVGTLTQESYPGGREITWHSQKVEVGLDTSLDVGNKEVGGFGDDFQVPGLGEYTECQSRLIMTINPNTVCFQDVLATAER